MPVRKAIPEKDGVYFITFTCNNWLPLFKLCNAYDTVYNWFNHLKQNRHYIIGYVIMPSHVHAVIAFSNTGKLINSIISNGKRFIAYDLVTRLQQQNSGLILNELSSSVNNTERKEGKLHNVFETSFDWKPAWRQTGNSEQKNSFNINWIIYTSILVKQSWLNCLNNINIVLQNIISQARKVFTL